MRNKLWEIRTEQRCWVGSTNYCVINQRNINLKSYIIKNLHAFLPALVLETLENQGLKTGGTLPSSLSKSGDSFPYMENFEILHETELPFSTQ